MYQFVVPNTDTSVQFKDEEGKDLALVDVAELETIIIQCRIEDPHFRATDPLRMNAWFGRVAKALSARIGKTISISVASLLIRKVMDTMKNLKKTTQYDQLWTLLPSMELTDSNSSEENSTPSSNSDSCTPTSPDSEPSASFASDTPTPG